MKIVFMGVCGCGKTTLAEKTAAYLACGEVVEADRYHSPETKEKMRSGIPLTDEDRWPWLDRLNQAMRDATAEWTVVTCSALKRGYRERLARGLEGQIRFILLDAPKSLLLERLGKRQHEYMPISLLDSQLATLERPGVDEPVTTVSTEGTEEETLKKIREAISSLKQSSKTACEC
jgi:gluconokinase